MPAENDAAFFDEASFHQRTPQEIQNMTELEKTIHCMQMTQVCAHPQHLHSFQTVNFMLTGSVRNCSACQTRMQSVVFASSDSSKQIVKCVACGILAHRTCAFSRHTHWDGPCPVNQETLWNITNRQKGNVDSSSLTPSLLDQEEGNDDDWEQENSHAPKPTPASTSKSVATNPPLETTTPSSTSVPIHMEWTQEGPPRHWAVDNPNAIVSTITIPKETTENIPNNDEDEVHITSLHHADHPFASVSRALQENIIAHFRTNKTTTAEEVEPKEETTTDMNDTTTEALQVQAKPSMEEEEEAPKDHQQQPSTISQLANAVRTTVNLPAKLGMASVAGGIAGGVAGLAMAGPAGAYAGYQMGETLGALGVILEGSVSIGVVVASVATASFTAKKIQTHMEERRVLTMGEEGISRKVLLVRPNIHVDPAWEDITREAKRKAPKSSAGSFFFVAEDNARYQRDEDIVQQSEQDIPTPDKVLLLASRILNDKKSLPGHVYRSLIQTFEERCAEPVEEKDVPSRRRRDDVHAVIKHVTATLLEVRPGFGHNAALTELTATAVEGFVFGRVYDLVFEEIQQEVDEKDADLALKIHEFEKTRGPGAQEIMYHISESALQALGLLPASHTAVEKLSYCTRFLEQISEHFSTIHGSSGGLCADSLLKMVCQHVLMTKLKGINAEIAFLEEFARDEQLLRGKEGYSLVTLQAALHFLNLCSDIENDIFEQDNDERNVPVTPSETQRAIAESLQE